MSNANSTVQNPWRDVQLDAAAQFSALCIQVTDGRYPWDEPQVSGPLAEQRPAAPRRAVPAFDLLIV